MPPQLALSICILFILCLFIIDRRPQSNVSFAVWLPTIWMTIIASRPLSLWLFPADVSLTADALIEGIPFDRNVFLTLIIAGFFILARRKIYWTDLVNKNIWIFLLFLYFGISIAWSDLPFVSFKRWIKAIGNLTMVLIILTDPDPIEAVKTMIRRCAFVLIPLSVVLVKYYPHLSVYYDAWTGVQMIKGIAWDKNGLGYLCLVCGFFFSWNLLIIWRKRDPSIDKKAAFFPISFLIMIAWLLSKANSKTSLISLIIGIACVISFGLPMIRRNVKNIGTLLVLSIFIILFLQLSIDIFGIVPGALGRDTTLTGRTFIWKDLYGIGTNPLIGTGFESFWLGDRLSTLSAIKSLRNLNEAHNGYLEVYLNSGMIGLFLLIGVIISSYKKILKTFMVDFDYGRFQMGFLIMALVYNITESAFKGFHLVWYIFLLISVYVPRERPPQAALP